MKQNWFICGLCGNQEQDIEATKLPMGIDGSSSMRICWNCRLGLIEILKQMRSVASRARLGVMHEKR